MGWGSKILELAANHVLINQPRKNFIFVYAKKLKTLPK